jgi:uncharacterized protein
MDRTIEAALEDWRQDSHRKPILLRGARQVGKSYTVSQFGRGKFENLVVINLEAQPELAGVFDPLNPTEIVSKLEVLTGQLITPGKTLLFIDEIQVLPQAIVALRYFYEQLPTLHVIAAGSLLELTLSAAGIPMPVGRVQYLYMKPMSFVEFLLAMGQQAMLQVLQSNRDMLSDQTVHQALLEWIRKYLLIGGMPEVVAQYQASDNYERCRRIQTSLLQTYRDDFNKYAKHNQHQSIGKVFQSAVQQVGDKFKYSRVDPDSPSRNIKEALEWLTLAGIYHKVTRSTADGLPLGANTRDRFFKVIFLDVGLMQNLCGLASDIVQEKDLMAIYRGALMEQFVGQELIAYEDCYTKPELFYWARDAKSSSAELDYVCQHEAGVVPLEVKTGKTGRLKSLLLFLEEKQYAWGVKVSASPLQYEKPVLSVPFYLLGYWKELWSNVDNFNHIGTHDFIP